jgi:3-deoxy-7-phosphoheptulonate synthase
VHVILRGGSKGPNYSAEHVKDCGEKVLKAGLMPKIMVSVAFRRHGARWLTVH